jgi:hypothetical protein
MEDHPSRALLFKPSDRSDRFDLSGLLILAFPATNDRWLCNWNP